MKSRLRRVVFLAMECVLSRARRSRSVSCSALLYLKAASGEQDRREGYKQVKKSLLSPRLHSFSNPWGKGGEGNVALLPHMHGGAQLEILVT